MDFFITLIGLMLIFEGLPYAAFPEAMQRWLRQLLAMPPHWLRRAGLIAMGLGLLLCWLAQRTQIFTLQV